MYPEDLSLPERHAISMPNCISEDCQWWVLVPDGCKAQCCRPQLAITLDGIEGASVANTLQCLMDAAGARESLPIDASIVSSAEARVPFTAWQAHAHAASWNHRRVHLMNDMVGSATGADATTDLANATTEMDTSFGSLRLQVLVERLRRQGPHVISDIWGDKATRSGWN